MMTPDEKRIALGMLSTIQLHGHVAGRSVEGPVIWIAHHDDLVEVCGDGLRCSTGGRGSDPPSAICDLWRQCADELPADKYLVMTDHTGKQRKVRWSGMAWKETA